MAKQTFTAGQVLTAAQMTSLQANDYNWTTSAQTASYVLVAANAGQTVTMTSASATTITVNTGLFAAGDRINILNLGTGTCTITAGTATVNSAGSLALSQYASGTLWFSSTSAAIFMPDDRGAGFTRVGGATFSAVASVEFANSLFTSTYSIYYVAMNITSSSGNQTLSLRVRNNSGPVTGANYTGQTYMIRATDGTLSTNNTSAATSQVIGRASTVTTPIGLFVANPASATIRTAWWGQGAQRDSNGDVAANTISGQYTVDEAHTGLNFFVAGTMTGSYNVYGLAES